MEGRNKKWMQRNFGSLILGIGIGIDININIDIDVDVDVYNNNKYYLVLLVRREERRIGIELADPDYKLSKRAATFLDAELELNWPLRPTNFPKRAVTFLDASDSKLVILRRRPPNRNLTVSSLTGNA